MRKLEWQPIGYLFVAPAVVLVVVFVFIPIFASLFFSFTLRGNEVHFPTLTSSATDSRNSSAPWSRQTLLAFFAMLR